MQINLPEWLDYIYLVFINVICFSGICEDNYWGPCAPFGLLLLILLLHPYFSFFSFLQIKCCVSHRAYED